MKKFIVVLACFLCCFTLNAQWYSRLVPGDELLDTEDTIVYRFQSGGDSFVCWDTEDYIKINSGGGTFDYELLNGASYFTALVGFYNNDGTLVEKTICDFICEDHDASQAFSLSDEVSKKIILFLMTGEGKVRIVAEKYRGTKFDISIPVNPNITTKVFEL